MRFFPKGYESNRDRGMKSWGGPNRGNQCRCGTCGGQGFYSQKKHKPSSRSGSSSVGDACKDCRGTGWVKR